MSKESTPIRFGVVGYAFGQFLVKTLVDLPGADVVAVADDRSQALEGAARQYGFVPYRDAADMLEREALTHQTIELA